MNSCCSRPGPKFKIGQRVGRSIVALAFFALVPSTRAGESETFRIYELNWQKAEAAYAAKDYERAATHYKKVVEVLRFEPVSRFQLAPKAFLRPKGSS